MRRLAVLAALLVAPMVASAENAHDEMAAALIAQADLHPTPIMLPTTAQASPHAASQTGVKHGNGPQAANAQANADDGKLTGQANAAAHHAQNAASSAAGQANAEAAKLRQKDHPPHPTHPTH